MNPPHALGGGRHDANFLFKYSRRTVARFYHCPPECKEIDLAALESSTARSSSSRISEVSRSALVGQLEGGARGHSFVIFTCDDVCLVGRDLYPTAGETAFMRGGCERVGRVVQAAPQDRTNEVPEKSLRTLLDDVEARPLATS